jgi:hypothetical protein
VIPEKLHTCEDHAVSLCESSSQPETGVEMSFAVIKKKNNSLLNFHSRVFGKYDTISRLAEVFSIIYRDDPQVNIVIDHIKRLVKSGIEQNPRIKPGMFKQS